MLDLARMRESYRLAKLTEADLAASWHHQLANWLEDAMRSEVTEPSAMVVATAGADGAPGARTVLLKGLDERGLVFNTNLRSRKGRELAENPRASAVLVWLDLQRQVIVDGSVEAVEGAEADAYFASRPRGSRIAAIVSSQSEVIASRETLDRRWEELATSHHEPTRPEWWGGVRVVPSSVEFWQGRENRLHDRLRYRLTGSGDWVIERLAP
ncbi:MAG: pyridoxamine 5'-phosphate oxidase [Thermoleophilaceae bacterium]